MAQRSMVGRLLMCGFPATQCERLKGRSHGFLIWEAPVPGPEAGHTEGPAHIYDVSDEAENLGAVGGALRKALRRSWMRWVLKGRGMNSCYCSGEEMQ